MQSRDASQASHCESFEPTGNSGSTIEFNYDRILIW